MYNVECRTGRVECRMSCTNHHQLHFCCVISERQDGPLCLICLCRYTCACAYLPMFVPIFLCLCQSIPMFVPSYLCACLPVSLPLPPSSNSPVCFVIFSFSVSLSLSHFPPLFGRLHGRGHNTTQRSAELEQGERGRGHH